MKLGLALLVVLAVAAPSVEAGIFGLGRKAKFPKAIDYPIVRPNVREYHKPGSRMKHFSLGADAAVAPVTARA
jgi:hypothetical protein